MPHKDVFFPFIQHFMIITEPELAYHEPEPMLEPEPRESEPEKEPTPIVRAKRGRPSKADIHLVLQLQKPLSEPLKEAKNFE